MLHVSRFSGRLWILVLAIVVALSGGTTSRRRRDPRGSRARHPGRRPLPQGPAAGRRLLGRGRRRGEDGDDQPGHAGPADGRREARLADDPQGAGLPPQVRAATSSAAPTRSRCRRWSSPPPSRTGTVCGSSPTSSGWSGPRSSPAIAVVWPGSWTYSDSKRPSPATTRTPSTPCSACNAASEAGVPVKPEVWTLARELLGEVPEPRRRLGLHAAITRIDREHDLRRGLQPDHHRLEAVPGPGIPPGRDDPELRQGRDQPRTCRRGIDWLARHFQVGQNYRQRPAVEVSTISTAWSGPAGSRASGSSARTTGIASAPRSWSTTRTSSPASGRAH